MKRNNTKLSVFDPRKIELRNKVRLAVRQAKQEGLNESEVIKTINGVITIEKLIGGKND